MGHSTWVRLKAIQNYEKFMKSVIQIDIENTVIDLLKKTNLGVMGWRSTTSEVGLAM